MTEEVLLVTHLRSEVLGCVAAVVDVYNAPGATQPVAVLTSIPGKGRVGT
jgi:hypothetical protein